MLLAIAVTAMRAVINLLENFRFSCLNHLINIRCYLLSNLQTHLLLEVDYFNIDVCFLHFTFALLCSLIARTAGLTESYQTIPYVLRNTVFI